ERARVEERDPFDGLPVPAEEAIDRGHAHLLPADVRPQGELEEHRVSGRAPPLERGAEVRHEREEIPERLLAGIEPDGGRQPRRLQAAVGIEDGAEALGIDRGPPEVRELRDERPGRVFRGLAPLVATEGAELGGDALDGKAELLAHGVPVEEEAFPGEQTVAQREHARERQGERADPSERSCRAVRASSRGSYPRRSRLPRSSPAPRAWRRSRGTS